MNILIKNGHIIDPSQGIDGIGDVLIEEGKIIELRVKSQESGAKDNKTQNSELKTPNYRCIYGLYVFPGSY